MKTEIRVLTRKKIIFQENYHICITRFTTRDLRVFTEMAV